MSRSRLPRRACRDSTTRGEERHDVGSALESERHAVAARFTELHPAVRLVTGAGIVAEVVAPDRVALVREVPPPELHAPVPGFVAEARVEELVRARLDVVAVADET